MPNKNYGVLIKTNEGLIGMIVSKQDKNFYVEFPREEVDQLGDSDLKSLTKAYRKKLGLSLAFGIEANALKNTLNKALEYSLRDEGFVDEIIDFVKKGYEKGLYISINPILDFVLSTDIKYTPASLSKKFGYKLQKRIFD